MKKQYDFGDRVYRMFQRGQIRTGPRNSRNPETEVALGAYEPQSEEEYKYGVDPKRLQL